MAMTHRAWQPEAAKTFKYIGSESSLNLSDTYGITTAVKGPAWGWNGIMISTEGSVVVDKSYLF